MSGASLLIRKLSSMLKCSKGSDKANAAVALLLRERNGCLEIYLLSVLRV
jgi:hypothetical protein